MPQSTIPISPRLIQLAEQHQEYWYFILVNKYTKVTYPPSYLSTPPGSFCNG
eukprot:TRINITY_DN40_c0_g3_i10.p4 TRINITY_DN40_c0_g3~~TRINITY_DN40_c0_g3_i10.p4  ORF type:complete len:52 (-),score=3.12 TRINITY_DN40_c0_g3_i10:1597-1752(-)